MTIDGRKNNYRARVLERAGEAVLDIPDIRILESTSPRKLVDGFQESWGVEARSVVLPAVSSDGINFDNTCGLSKSVATKDVDLREKVAGFAKLGCDVYISLDPGFRFVSTAPLFVVDSTGDSARRVCISKPRVQEMVAHTLADAISLVLEGIDGTEARLRGVVANCVDLWPMSAADGRIELTCFCADCVERLTAEAMDDEAVGRFQDFPSPANLLLQDNQSGIGYADDFNSESSPKRILALARLKGYIEAFGRMAEEELEENASALLGYLLSRHRVTVDSVLMFMKSGVELALEEASDLDVGTIDRIVVVEGSQYNWTGGLFLDLLDTEGPFDEVWFDPSTSDLSFKRSPFRAFMWRRSRYVVDSFFDYATSVADAGLMATTGLGRLADVQIMRELNSRLRSALGASMTGFTNLSALPGASVTEPDGPGRRGFVGVGFDLEIAQAVLSKVKVASNSYGPDSE
jgi:hypothetical protein